jgi:hypothetical protein
MHLICIQEEAVSNPDRNAFLPGWGPAENYLMRLWLYSFLPAGEDTLIFTVHILSNQPIQYCLSHFVLLYLSSWWSIVNATN